jgi:hypothetical protein
MTVASGFEDGLGDAVLDATERRAREEVAPLLRERIQSLLRNYGRRHDYRVQPVVEATRTSVDRAGGTVTVRAELPHPAYLFEVGTDAHEITPTNADVLSFIWERRHDPPQWVREKYEREGDGWRVFLPKVEVEGLPEGRFVRDALHDIRRELEMR